MFKHEKYLNNVNAKLVFLCGEDSRDILNHLISSLGDIADDSYVVPYYGTTELRKKKVPDTIKVPSDKIKIAKERVDNFLKEIGVYGNCIPVHVISGSPDGEEYPLCALNDGASNMFERAVSTMSD